MLSTQDAPVLQVEFTQANALAAGTSNVELFDMLIGYGYQMYRYIPDSNAIEAVGSAPGEGHCNLYAIKNLKAVHARLSRPQAPAVISGS